MSASDLVPLLDAAASAAPFLLPLALKAALLFALGWGAARLVRGASAAWRHAVWAGTLAAVLAVTLLPLALPAWEIAVPLLPADPAPVEAPAPAPTLAPLDAAPAPAGPALEAPALEGPAVAASAPAEPAVGAWLLAHPLAALVLLWGAGALAVGAWWLLGALAAWRLASRAAPVKDGAWLALLAEVADDLGLRTPVRLLESARLSVPVTWGAVGPVLILPAGADAWGAERRRAVLAHELAHVRRRDVLWQWVAQLACALHWYQPLAWVAYRRLLAERERACDDSVLRSGTRPSAYADVLLDVARAVRRREPVAALAMAPMARPSQLEGRLLSILDPATDRRALSRVLLSILGAVTLLLVGALAGVRAVPAAADYASGLGAESLPVAGAPGGLPVAAPARAAPPAMEVGLFAFDEDFQWTGSLAPGKRLIVKNTNGEIDARGGDDDRAVVAAAKQDRGRGDAADVEIEVVEFDEGVVVCVRYPGQRGACSEDESPRGETRGNNTSVDFDVRVPRGVHFVGTSVNGEVEALDLTGDVVATSVNGEVRATTSGGDAEVTSVNGTVAASASGSVRASTVNGTIEADMGRADWAGTAEFSTVNGSIELTLPSDLSAEVDAEAMNGDIRSDFPLEIRRGRYVGASASGTIGGGGRRLELHTQNGSIELRRSRAGVRGGRSAGPDRAAAHADFRAAVADTLRATRRLARIASPTTDHDDLDLHVDERGLRLLVNGEVEVDLDWRDLADEAAAAVEDALDAVDWDAIADEVEAAMEEVDVEVQVELGEHLGAPCPEEAPRTPSASAFATV